VIGKTKKKAAGAACGYAVPRNTEDRRQRTEEAPKRGVISEQSSVISKTESSFFRVFQLS